MSLNPYVERIARKAADANRRMPGDYTRDGLLHCGACNTPKQCRISYAGATRVFPCNCECAEQRVRERAEEERKRRNLEAIQRLKANCIHDKGVRDWTFQNDDGTNPGAMDKARRYFGKWEQMYKDGIGLLLYGDVGTGKTFFSACIANALIDQGIPALMTNFSKIINALSGLYGQEKNSYIQSLNSFRLLVIDDLGVERQSDYALESVYSVIDARCRNGQPMIVTTNIPLKEIKEQHDPKLRRIYDRVLGMCVPIKITGESRRRKVHADKLEKARELLNG